MDKHDLKRLMEQLNQRPIAIFPIYIHITGSLAGGLLLSQILYWYKTMEGEFYKTDADFMSETHMTQTEFRNAKKVLSGMPFMFIKAQGIPARTFYSVDYSKLAEVILEASLEVTYQQGKRLSTNKRGGNLRTITETTQETTTKTTTEKVSFSIEKEPVGKIAEEFERTGEPEPVKIRIKKTPPELRATPPANEVYQMYEAWAQFIEAKGIPVAKKPSGHYDMDKASASNLKLWAKWAMGMPGEGTPLERWQAFIQAAWGKADKFLKNKFTPSMLYNQRMNVVMAVNAQAVKDKEYVEMASQGFDFDAYLRGEIEI